MGGIFEILEGMLAFGISALKTAGGFIFGLGFPMGLLVLLAICALFFFGYQQLEHIITSGATRMIIMGIIVGLIGFGLITFILPA